MVNIIVDDIDSFANIDTTNYISLPIMTKYEFNLLIGLRTLHISRGATPFVELPENFTIKRNMELRSIAIKELIDGRLPYIVKRCLPNNIIEYWPISKLNLQSVRHLMRS